MVIHMIRKCLAIGIILLFLATTCIPVLASEGKPDFIIDDIFLWPSDIPNKYHFEYRLKNIGDAPIYNFRHTATIQIRWMIFGKIPLITVYSNNIDGGIGALLPGDSINIGFVSCDTLPKFGSYRFSLTVNPNKIIDESDYDNNKYSEDWKVFLWDWKEI